MKKLLYCNSNFDPVLLPIMQVHAFTVTWMAA